MMRDPEKHDPDAFTSVRVALRDHLGLDHEQAAGATDALLASLLESGYTVAQPARLGSSRVEEMLPAARVAWESATTGPVDDDGLRAVVTELVPLIAYQLGHSHGYRAGHHNGRRR